MRPSTGAAARLGGTPATQFVTQPPTPLDGSEEVNGNLPLLPVLTSFTTDEAGSVPAPPAKLISTRYTVVEGDTLGDVAERSGISLQTLVWANSLTSRISSRSVYR